MDKVRHHTPYLLKPLHHRPWQKFHSIVVYCVAIVVVLLTATVFLVPQLDVRGTSPYNDQGVLQSVMNIRVNLNSWWAFQYTRDPLNIGVMTYDFTVIPPQLNVISMDSLGWGKTLGPMGIIMTCISTIALGFGIWAFVLGIKNWKEWYFTRGLIVVNGVNLFLIAFILSVGLATVNPEMLNLLQHASIDGSKLDDDFTKYIHEVTAGIWSDHNNTEITSWKFQCIDSALTFAGRAIIMLMFGVFGISGTVLVYGTIKRYK